MNKIFKIIVGVFALSLFLGVGVSFSGSGSGTDTDSYQIENWTHLNEVRNDLHAHYILMNDLDEETDGYDEHIGDPEDGWKPIGDDDNKFEGTFDGDGYEIGDLYIDRDDENYIGLFGYNEGTIKNLSLVGVDISGDVHTGGVVGSNDGTISTSYVEGEVSGEKNNVGGIAGRNEGIVEKSHTTINVNGGSWYTGGLVGRHHVQYLIPIRKEK